jgi:hypothetical protein
LDEAKALNLGVAAHITAASAGGPRYDATLSSEQRSAASNGIWLCQNCAKLIDNDGARFTTELLRAWVLAAHDRALNVIGKSVVARPDIQDKFVTLEYPQRAGITKALEEEGYRLYWSTGDQLAERLDLEGWEVVEWTDKDGSTFRLRIRDSTCGDLFLLKLKRS